MNQLSPAPQTYYPNAGMIPKRIVLIALYFAIVGGDAMMSMIEGAFSDGARIRLEVLMLPVAYGLLTQNRYSRWTATFWLAVGFLIYVIGLVALPAETASFSISLWGKKSPEGSSRMLMVFCIGMMILSIILMALLHSKKSKAFLEGQAASDRSVKPPDTDSRSAAAKA